MCFILNLFFVFFFFKMTQNAAKQVKIGQKLFKIGRIAYILFHIFGVFLY